MRALGSYQWTWVLTFVVQVLVAASMNAQWDTSFGVVEGTEFGSGTKLAITIHGMNPALVNEWRAVAVRLGEEGYHVLSPNFHSNPKTAPGSLTDQDTITVLRDLMTAAGAARIATLLGKSWGGGRALTFATQSDVLDRLVLVAPAGSPEGTVSCPTALFWAEDDPTIPVLSSEGIRQALSQEYLFHLEPVGGHKILPEYTEHIVSFANADFSHGANDRSVHKHQSNP